MSNILPARFIRKITDEINIPHMKSHTIGKYVYYNVQPNTIIKCCCHCEHVAMTAINTSTGQVIDSVELEFSQYFKPVEIFFDHNTPSKAAKSVWYPHLSYHDNDWITVEDTKLEPTASDYRCIASAIKSYIELFS